MGRREYWNEYHMSYTGSYKAYEAQIISLHHAGMGPAAILEALDRRPDESRPSDTMVSYILKKNGLVSAGPPHPRTSNWFGHYLTMRAAYILNNMGCKGPDDVARYSYIDLLSEPNCGKVTAKEIAEEFGIPVPHGRRNSIRVIPQGAATFSDAELIAELKARGYEIPQSWCNLFFDRSIAPAGRSN